jgi:hypothetical protein
MSSAHVGSLPFPLSSLALDISSSCVRRLFSFPAPDAEYTWREGARVAAPPELAPMCLHWGLTRVLYLLAMSFACQSGGDSIRDASHLTEPEPARPQSSPKARLHQFGGARS